MIRRIALPGLAMLLIAGAVHAQQPVDYSKVEITIARHSDNFFTLEGQGGTITELTGPDGVLMVDGQFVRWLYAELKKPR